MSYAYTGSADATAIAAQYAADAANVTGTPVDPSTGLPPAIDPADGYIQQMCDTFLKAFGFQGQSDGAGTGQSNATATYADVFASWSFTPPIAKTYWLHVDVGCYMTASPDSVQFRVHVDGASTGVTDPVNAQSYFFNALSDHRRIHWVQKIVFATAAAHTIQLQWKTTGTGTVNASSADCRCFTVTG